MSDIVTKAVETVEPVQVPEVDVKGLQEQLEAIKKSQSGSDKAYQEQVKAKLALEIELEKLKKEKMSEKEKAEYEFNQQKVELDKKSREVAEATLRLSTNQIIIEKHIPIEMAEYIRGANEEEIRLNADTFIKRFNDAVGKGVEAKLAGNKPPQAGTQEQIAPLPEDWRTLEKRFTGR